METGMLVKPGETLVNYSLYLVTDSDLSRGRPLLEIVRAAVDGGVTCVQVREKTVSSRAYLERLAPVRGLLRERGIPLFVNDRIDIALAMEADGVHLGQTDIPLSLARRIAGDRLIIGISCETTQDAIEAEQGGADYVSVSPVFGTPTKTDTAPPLGLDGVRAIRAAVRVPVVTIGGITAANAANVIRAGADGICVVSAIVAAPDPRAAAAALRGIVEGARHGA
jgi:thiamine-phosphate pyrophosphorylase